MSRWEKAGLYDVNKIETQNPARQIDTGSGEHPSTVEKTGRCRFECEIGMGTSEDPQNNADDAGTKLTQNKPI